VSSVVESGYRLTGMGNHLSDASSWPSPKPIASKALERATNDVGRAMTNTKASAEHLSRTLVRTAAALEKSAALAEEHALRSARAGREGEAADERRAAERARQAAERARGRAAEASDWAVR
jgi:methyl-accepting chemotaxis protein